MRTVQCPLCQSRWKVEPNGMNGSQDHVWLTCAVCEARALRDFGAQDIHEADEYGKEAGEDEGA